MTTNVQSTSPHGTGYRLRKGVRLGLNYLLLILLAIFFLFPTVFMLVSSIKSNETQVLVDMTNLYAFVPRGEISLQNYADVFDAMPFGRFMFNSIFIVGAMVILGLFVNSLIAYALAR
ncbi:MAG TPA: carbohydrate ABC transporter permease, partial [Caldilineae bacterium]|nr:carbohydrate ABC transporter permease [Caldilineae bacterium]